MAECSAKRCPKLTVKIVKLGTRQSEIAVVRRLFKMGRQMLERRSKTLRRLFHPPSAQVWSLLKKYAIC